jgi:isoleucyl-tRNA synthetase
VPGWDCHGLPIEWKVEEQYRAKKRDKDQVPVVEFRRECRAFADHWLDGAARGVQATRRRWRLGQLLLDDEVRVRGRDRGRAHASSRMSGGLYQGLQGRAVERSSRRRRWPRPRSSIRTHVSDTVHVRFPIFASRRAASSIGASVVIWTTTPWTMPAQPRASPSRKASPTASTRSQPRPRAIGRR